MGVIHGGCTYSPAADGETRLIGSKKTIRFINEEGSSVHGAIRTSAVFASESGEWKLGAFDILSSMKDDDAIIYVRLHLENSMALISAHHYTPFRTMVLWFPTRIASWRRK